MYLTVVVFLIRSLKYCWDCFFCSKAKKIKHTNMNTFSHFVFYVLSLGDILQYSIFYYFFRFNLFFNLFVIKFTFFLLLLWSKKGTQILLHYNHAASYLPYGTVPCLYTQTMIEKTKMNIKLCKSLSIFLLVCQAYSNDFR